jgi:putative FmdB family regulatory protein
LYVPNYEYQCTACNHRFELWQNVGEAAPACSECGEAVKKIFHVPRVIFKGSGFYVTDLRAEKSGGKSEATEAKSESKSESGGESAASSSATSGDSKSESTSSGSSSTTPASSSSPASASGDAK